LIFLIFSLIYLSQAILLLCGLSKRKNLNPGIKPFVTIIVAARNEEGTILPCLFSLANVTYPQSLLEIIIVNDRSTDRTGEIVEKFTNRYPHFKYLQITKTHPFLSGKAGALSQALKISKGEFIFITDADCTVNPNWILDTLPYFTEQVGLVAGITLVQASDQKYSLFSRIQALDWIYLLSVAAGAAHLGKPLSCIGNNFAFRKIAYEKIGGYESVGFSLTEDYALLRTMDRQTKWKIVFAMSESCLVYSRPVKGLHAFVQQRKRWAMGGLKVRLYGKFLIALGNVTHLLLGISLFFSNFIWCLLLVIAADLILLSHSLRKIRQLKLLKYYPLYKVFYGIYLILLPILILLNRKIVWKDTVYS